MEIYRFYYLLIVFMIYYCQEFIEVLTLLIENDFKRNSLVWI